MTITPADLAAMRARLNAATPGPWKVRPKQYDDWGWVRAADGHLVADLYSQARREKSWEPAYASQDWEAGPPQIASNAEFIAHVRTDHARALDEIDRLRQAQTWRDFATGKPAAGAMVLMAVPASVDKTGRVTAWNVASGYIDRDGTTVFDGTYISRSYQAEPRLWMPLTVPLEEA